VAAFLVPPDGEVSGVEFSAQPVPDQVDDALELERTGDTLLDAVDQGQLGVALRELAAQRIDFNGREGGRRSGFARRFADGARVRLAWHLTPVAMVGQPPFGRYSVVPHPPQ
jgi:hypothetical protein